MSTGGPVARGRRALACAFACVLGLALMAPQGAAAATPYQTAVLGSTPSSYLRLGESTGTTAANEVAAAASGTYGSGVTLGAIGADSPDAAVQFGGAGYVTVPDGTDTGPTGDMALEAWVKPASVITAQAILEKYGRTSTTGGANNSLDGYALRMNAGGTVSASLYNSAGGIASATSAQPLAVGRWAHVVASHDGSVLRLYVNGQLAGSTTITLAATRSPNPLFVGAASGPAPGSGGSVFSGRIDEVAVYDRALTATEVSDHFASAVPSPEVVAAPGVTGTATQGSTLSASGGTWSPSAAPATSYQWQRCTGIGVGCTDITGATAATYVPVAADAGKRLTAKVTATNSAGSATTTTAPTAAVGYAGSVASANPSAYLRLGESAGATMARNEVAGAPDGSYLGAVTFAQQGVEPYDLAPALMGGYVSVPDGAATAPTGDMAVEVWVKPYSTTAAVPIVEKYGHTSTTGGANDSRDGYQLRLNANGTVTATLYGSAGATVTATSTQALVAGRWAHIVAANDGSTLRVYINGDATGSVPVTFATTRSPNPLFIGGASGPAPGPPNKTFTARFDEVAIYDRGLTATEVTDHFNRGVSRPELFSGAGVNGIPVVGSTLTVSNGTWSPAVVPAFTYQWQRCRYKTYSCTDIPGETSPTYVVTAADNVYRLTCIVTATNSAGSTSTTPGATVPVGYGGTVWAAGPLAYYRLGDPGGTTAQVESGFSNGTYGAGAVLNKAGVDSPDASVQIGSGPVSVPDYMGLSPTGDMSVEAWVKPAVIGTTQSIVEKYGHKSTTGGANDSFDGFGLRMNADGTVTTTLFGPAATAGATTSATNSQPLLIGRWAHLVAADDGSVLRLYVNGQVAASTPVTFATTRSTNPLHFGAASGPAPGFGGSPFSGRIDEVAVYDSGLSAAQVADHFSRAVAMPEVVTAPQLSGMAVAGGTVSVSTGVWSTTSPPTMSYQWQRCNSPTANCYDIAGATAPTYVPAAADAGWFLIAKVTARNSGGSATSTTAPTAAVGYPGAIAAANPSAYFRLGEVSGSSAKDEVAGAPDGVYGAGVALGRLGVVVPDKSVQLGSAAVSVPDAPATSPTGDMSVEAWVKPGSTGTAQSIVEKYGHASTTGGANDSLDGYRLRMNNDGTVTATLFGSAGATAAATSALPLTVGRWAHLVAADDGSTLSLYVNGQVAASSPVAFVTTRSSSALALGAASGPAPGAGGSFFSGRIDEVALYDRALTAAEIGDHAARGVAFPENVSPPTVSGTLDDASTLTVDPGVWSPMANPSFAYQWQRCPGATGTTCSTISGATSSTYAPTKADIGSRFLARVTASNSSGSPWINSAITGVVHSFDNADPGLSASGEVFDNVGGWLGPGPHPLHLAATDGTAQSPGSGITSIELKVDGSREAYWSQPCTTRNCSMTQDFSFDSGTHADGHHVITAIATDDSGRTTTLTLQVNVDKVAPVMTLGGTLRDDMAAEHTASGYTLQANASDAAGATGPLSGVESVEILIDGVRADYASQSCAQGGCTLNRSFTYTPATYGEGDHGARVVVRDQAGNETVREWTVKGHLTTACQPTSAPSTAPVGDVSPGAAPVSTQTATDAVAQVDPTLVDDNSHDPTPPGSPGQPGVQGGPDSLTTTGTDATTTIDRNPRNGFSTSLDGTTLCVRPTSVDPAAKDAAAVSTNAVVSPDTGSASDTVVKPTPTGIETFTSIRKPDAPQAYDWKVEAPGNQLQQRADGGVSIIDPNAHYSESQAGSKPADQPADPAALPVLVSSDSVPPDTVAGDPGAAPAATAAADVSPPQDEPPADITQPLVDQPPPDKPPDAPVAETDAQLVQDAQQNQQDISSGVGADLAASRNQADAQTTDAEIAKANTDQQLLDTPVEVGQITPPSATDASGMAVPSSLSVDGNSVTLNVDHANPDVVYPVVADPWVMVKRVVPVWRCCRPVYRYETRIDHYVNELRLVTWAPGSTIFRYPHTALGGNLYSVRIGGSIGTVLMINQATSPVWWAVQLPVYKTVPVYDHSEPWIDLVEQQAPEWVDDPSPPLPSSHPTDDPSRYDIAPIDGNYEEIPANFCPDDPGNPDSGWCGDAPGANAALDAAKAAAPLEMNAQEPVFTAGKCTAKRGWPWGISEQQVATFNDKRLVDSSNPTNTNDRNSLNVRRARLQTPYNTMDNPNKLAKADAWIRRMHALCIEPLITFYFDPDNKGHLPPYNTEYGPAVRRFVDAHDSGNLRVWFYTAWNEPNDPGGGGPTAPVSNADDAARFYRRLSRICSGRCAVAAGDFASPVSKSYFKGYKDHAGKVDVWAYHAYASSKKKETAKQNLDKFLAALKNTDAKVWLTEQGGRVVPGWDSATEQANLILGLPKSYSDRITRFYYYSWIGDNAYNNPPKPNAWDSGLIDWRTNKERPQWRSFKNRILGGAP